VTWIETHSASFEARHEAADSDDVRLVLDRLEQFRSDLSGRFERLPEDVAVVIHGSPAMLAVAHPWLELARLAASPASRRYFGGWFTSGEIHVLAPKLLEERASKVAGSAETLRLAPLHEYAHLVIGANNPKLPPPFSPRSFRNYLRWAWLCEGAATWLAGQTPYLAPAIVSRMRKGRAPSLPPSARDAMLLGGSIFDLLAEGEGPDACVTLICNLEAAGPQAAIERAFARPLAEITDDWRRYLAELTAPEPTTTLTDSLPSEQTAPMQPEDARAERRRRREARRTG